MALNANLAPFLIPLKIYPPEGRLFLFVGDTKITAHTQDISPAEIVMIVLDNMPAIVIHSSDFVIVSFLHTHCKYFFARYQCCIDFTAVIIIL